MTFPGLAAALKVSETRLSALMVFDERLDADLALRMARYFGTTAEFWLNLRMVHTLARARLDSQRLIEECVSPRIVLGSGPVPVRG